MVIWPDADEPGTKAAADLVGELLEVGAARIRVITVDDHADGWDAADAVAEGWDSKRVADWASGRTRQAHPKANGAAAAHELVTAAEQHDQPDYPLGIPPRSAVLTWKELALATDAKDMPHATLSNASTILQLHSAFKEKIWYDSFRERIYHTLRGVPQEWTDVDSMRVTAFIQQQLQLSKFTLKLIQEAIIHAAHEDPRDSVCVWLDGLTWDGIERLSTWVGDCLGVALTAYSMAVSRNWILSMVARAYKPGCQVDTMPVLEGLQGRGKSSALEILGGEWYSAVGTAFGGPEFIQTIQGKWLIEIPDMAGFGRREHSHVIATITTRTDRYRMKYGRFDQDHPRKCIFAATSETDDYLPEMRGYRRYWPLQCTDIDLDALRGQREQIFAEAVNAWRDGEKFHNMPSAETDQEQRARGSDDPWTEDILMFCESRALAGHAVHPTQILVDAIQFEKNKLDRTSQLRVINILKAAGWIRKTIDNRRMYVKPRRVPT